MKKLINVFLLLTIILALCLTAVACTGGGGDGDGDSETEKVNVTYPTGTGFTIIGGAEAGLLDKDLESTLSLTLEPGYVLGDFKVLVDGNEVTLRLADGTVENDYSVSKTYFFTVHPTGDIVISVSGELAIATYDVTVTLDDSYDVFLVEDGVCGEALTSTSNVVEVSYLEPSLVLEYAPKANDTFLSEAPTFTPTYGSDRAAEIVEQNGGGYKNYSLTTGMYAYRVRFDAINKDITIEAPELESDGVAVGFPYMRNFYFAQCDSSGETINSAVAIGETYYFKICRDYAVFTQYDFNAFAFTTSLGDTVTATSTYIQADDTHTNVGRVFSFEVTGDCTVKPNGSLDCFDDVFYPVYVSNIDAEGGARIDHLEGIQVVNADGSESYDNYNIIVIDDSLYVKNGHQYTFAFMVNSNAISYHLDGFAASDLSVCVGGAGGVVCPVAVDPNNTASGFIATVPATADWSQGVSITGFEYKTYTITDITSESYDIYEGYLASGTPLTSFTGTIDKEYTLTVKAKAGYHIGDFDIGYNISNKLFRNEDGSLARNADGSVSFVVYNQNTTSSVSLDLEGIVADSNSVTVYGTYSAGMVVTGTYVSNDGTNSNRLNDQSVSMPYGNDVTFTVTPPAAPNEYVVIVRYNKLGLPASAATVRLEGSNNSYTISGVKESIYIYVLDVHDLYSYSISGLDGEYAHADVTVSGVSVGTIVGSSATFNAYYGEVVSIYMAVNSGKELQYIRDWEAGFTYQDDPDEHTYEYLQENSTYNSYDTNYTLIVPSDDTELDYSDNNYVLESAVSEDGVTSASDFFVANANYGTYAVTIESASTNCAEFPYEVQLICPDDTEETRRYNSDWDFYVKVTPDVNFVDLSDITVVAIGSAMFSTYIVDGVLQTAGEHAGEFLFRGADETYAGIREDVTICVNNVKVYEDAVQIVYGGCNGVTLTPMNILNDDVNISLISAFDGGFIVKKGSTLAFTLSSGTKDVSAATVVYGTTTLTPDAQGVYYLEANIDLETLTVTCTTNVQTAVKFNFDEGVDYYVLDSAGAWTKVTASITMSAGTGLAIKAVGDSESLFYIVGSGEFGTSFAKYIDENTGVALNDVEPYDSDTKYYWVEVPTETLKIYKTTAPQD